MRIVDRKTFLSLPGKTLYRKFEPDIYGDLEIKGETLNNDYQVVYSCGFIKGCKDCSDTSDAHDIAVQEGSDYRFDIDTYSRDGMFDKDQLFAVYDNEDIEQLIGKLKECLK